MLEREGMGGLSMQKKICQSLFSGYYIKGFESRGFWHDDFFSRREHTPRSLFLNHRPEYATDPLSLSLSRLFLTASLPKFEYQLSPDHSVQPIQQRMRLSAPPPSAMLGPLLLLLSLSPMMVQAAVLPELEGS